VAIKLRISMILASFVSMDDFGCDTVEIEEIAESIEEVLGIVSAILGDPLLVENVEKAGESGRE
jgi:hypothetical protein